MDVLRREENIATSGSTTKQMPQSALGRKTPLQAMKDLHKLKPELFRKPPYYRPGCDSYCTANLISVDDLKEGLVFLDTPLKYIRLLIGHRENALISASDTKLSDLIFKVGIHDVYDHGAFAEIVEETQFDSLGAARQEFERLCALNPNYLYQNAAGQNGGKILLFDRHDARWFEVLD